MSKTTTTLPPKTLEEVDVLIDELVKARLIARLAESERPAHNPSAAADSTTEAPDGGPGSGPSQTNSGSNASQATPVDVGEVQPLVSAEAQRHAGASPTSISPSKKSEPICSCSFCRFQKDPELKTRPVDQQVAQTFHSHLDAQVDRTLAVLAAAQNKHTEDKRLRDPSEWLDWYSQLFAAVIGICSLGAGFTFTILFSGIEVPSRVSDASYADDEEKARAERDAVEYIRTCLAGSWMLFVFAIGATTFTALIINTIRKLFVEEVRTAEGKGWKWGTRPVLLAVTWSTLFVQVLPVGAFLASAEALRQYNQGIGLVSLVGTGLAGVIVWFAWAWQNLEWWRKLCKCDWSRKKEPKQGGNEEAARRAKQKRNRSPSPPPLLAHEVAG